jgi:hypothetical protein
MATQILMKMRRAQALLRECHGWVSHNHFDQFHFRSHANFLDEQLVQNDELLLAVELCAIEGSLALLFENRGLPSSPRPGIQETELPPRVSAEYHMTNDNALNADIMSPTASLQ